MNKTDLVIAGNITIDDMVMADGTKHLGATGGDVLYAALAARLWGVRVGMLSRLGEDFPQENLVRCQDAGLDISGMPYYPGPGVRNWVIYHPDGRRDFEGRVPGLIEYLSPSIADIPPHYESADICFVAAMPIESQLELARHFSEQGKTVVFDPYEVHCTEKPQLVEETLRYTAVFLPSEVEVRRLRGDVPFEQAAREFAALGPNWVVIKLGGSGCLVYSRQADSCTYLPSYRQARVVDTTGAGDAFGGGLCAGLAQGKDMCTAALMGTATASIAIEDFGSTPLLARAPQEARQRLEDLLRQR
ncbi:carbohydrate kinase family protein [Neobittarella massiliensis]|uniref:carbohydrate kinase family protein n=1 Tax=Neobittarella massiliensis (ex Bilen et al. 2018) TaxID=2041842 RepID=UPI0013EC974B|nr:carbohydrate kinase family protein [Neobittarella massiliensis]